MKKHFLILLFIFVAFFGEMQFVSATNDLFYCDYNIIYNSSINGEKEGDKNYQEPLTFPLRTTVHDDGTATFINAGHELKNGTNLGFYTDEEKTFGSVYLAIDTKEYAEQATADGQYKCPTFTLDFTDATIYRLRNYDSGNTNGSSYTRVTQGGTPVLLNEESNDKIIKTTNSCPTKQYQANDIKGATFNFNLDLNMTSDGKKHVCIKLNGAEPSCSVINNTGGNIQFNNGYRQSNFMIDEKEVSKLFIQNFAQIEHNSFTCPGDVYFYEDFSDSSMATYWITTDKSLAEEYDKNSTLKDNDDDSNAENIDINMGQEVTGCEVIPIEIRKWINNILNFVKYTALALVIVLGVTDFIKAAASGEPDQMKKSGQSFIKRIAAVAILFLLPLIIELILNLVNLAGVDPNNTNCLK